MLMYICALNPNKGLRWKSGRDKYLNKQTDKEAFQFILRGKTGDQES